MAELLGNAVATSMYWSLKTILLKEEGRQVVVDPGGGGTSLAAAAAAAPPCDDPSGLVSKRIAPLDLRITANPNGCTVYSSSNVLAVASLPGFLILCSVPGSGVLSSGSRWLFSITGRGITR